MKTRFVSGGAAVVCCVGLVVAQDGWRYVGAEEGAGLPMSFHALELGPRPPDGVTVSAALRGAEPQFGQIRFGDAGSIRVAVVVDALPGGGLDLYVDSDRDRKIENDERMPGTGPAWRLALEALRSDGDLSQAEHRVAAFRWGRKTKLLGVGTLGFLEGRAKVGARSVPARRIDGDGNGLFQDPEDRIMLDLDGDGAWDPIDELFLYRPILLLDDVRYAVREAGDEGLVLTELAGMGTARLDLPRLDQGEWQAGTRTTVTMISKDGFVVGLSGTDPFEVPPGDYRVTNVQLTLPDEDGGRTWSYVFSTSGMRGEPRWHEMRAGTECSLDPVGELDFTAAVSAAADGRGVTVQPRLYTGDGLLINTCFRGTSDFWGGPSAAVELLSTEGQRLAQSSSGFA